MPTSNAAFQSPIRFALFILLLIFYSTLSSHAADQNDPDIKFLQDIQDQLTAAANLSERNILIQVTPERKRQLDATPSSIHLSYGFLRNMQNINQLIAIMAHMTAHISQDTVPTPPLPEDDSKPEGNRVGDYIKSAVRPRFPDKSNPPQATGSFHSDDPAIIERPDYQNREYNYAINKTDILRADQELEADKMTIKILSHAGLCPSDYSRMLHYFYDNPQLLVANRHFALETDQWQRIDALDRLASPKTQCSAEENSLAQNNAGHFDQLKVRILKALKTPQ